MTKNSARVMRTADGSETHVDFYVRAVGAKTRPFSTTEAFRDAWEAYREEPVWVPIDGSRVCLFRVTSVSSAPRASIEEAAADMYRAVRLELERVARLVRGDVPDGAQLVGADPLGDEG